MDEQGALSTVGGIFYLAIIILYFVALWKVYTKAGKPGWAVIIPFYNTYTLVKIAGRPGWWFLLFFIPLVNLIIYFIISVDLAKRFNRSTLFGVFMLGLFGMIGYPILGFGKSAYTTPVAQAASTPSISPTPPAVPPPTQPPSPA